MKTPSLLFLGLATFAYGQFQSDNVVLRWDSAALQCIRTVKPGPPMVARGLAMVHTAMFDAWAPYDGVAISTRLGASLRRPAQESTLDNKNKAASYAAYDVLLDLFPTQKAYLDNQLASLGCDPKDASTDLSTPSGIGHAAAKALLDYRHADGSNQLNGYVDTTGYQPTNTPTEIKDATRWQPLQVPNGLGGFNTQKYIGPHWGLVKPFALKDGSQFRPEFKVPDPASPEYAAQVAQLISYSALLTDQQKMISEYWADGPASETPPGHWCLLAQDLSRRDEHSVDDDIKMYFVLSNAVFDAGIAAWDAKRAYDSVRPVTAVHFLKKGKAIKAWGGPRAGTTRLDGADWQPYQAATFVTPPFPEYLSGHSTFSASAAEVLRRFSGSDVFSKSVTFKAGSSVFEQGAVPAADVMLSWSSFSEMADEAGISRRYGGIHFAPADLDGRKLGRQVGATVWEQAQRYINGSLAGDNSGK